MPPPIIDIPDVPILFPSIPSDDTRLPMIPLPLRTPIYICRHTFPPLPIAYPTSEPTPRFLPYPCKTCHFRCTQKIGGDIATRYRSAVEDLRRNIRLAEAACRPIWNDRAGEKAELYRKNKKDLLRGMEEEKDDAWKAFKKIWGTENMGNE